MIEKQEKKITEILGHASVGSIEPTFHLAYSSICRKCYKKREGLACMRLKTSKE